MAHNQPQPRDPARDSLLLLATLRIEGREGGHQVKVRNLSSGGLMAEGSLRVICGLPVAVQLRQIGWVKGVVAWVQDSRFGIAFDLPIDPLLARPQPHPGGAPAHFTRLRLKGDAVPTGLPLRKV